MRRFLSILLLTHAFADARPVWGQVVLDSMILRRTGEPNLPQAMAGRIPNLLTHLQGGEPGASAALQYRGPRSLAGRGEPLIVVDGLPVNNRARPTGGSVLQGAVTPNGAYHLNVQDIASVRVLSAAEAAAIYGALAGGDGVIVVETIHSRARAPGGPGASRGANSGQPFSYRFSSSIEIEEAARLFPLQRRFGVGSLGISNACTAPDCFLATNFGSWGPALSGTSPQDHPRELFDDGVRQQYQLAFSGGPGSTRMYGSLSWLDHGGIIAGDHDQYERATARIQGMHWLTDNVSLGASVTAARTRGDFVQRGNSANGYLLGGLRTPPEFDNRPYLGASGLGPQGRSPGVHRSWRFPNPSPTSAGSNRGFDNPFFTINETVSRSVSHRLIGGVHADWAVNRVLRVGYRGGVDLLEDERFEAFPISSSGTMNGGRVEDLDIVDRTIEQVLSSSAAWRRARWSGSLGAGYAFTRITSAESMQRTRQLQRTGERTRRARNNNGVALNGIAAWQDDLRFTAGVRSDHVSDIDAQIWSPAASVEWQLPIRPGIVIGPASVRAAIGRSAQPFSPYRRFDVLPAPSTSLAPEVTTELDVGGRVGFPRDRATVDVTYYRALTRDVILPASASDSALLQNVARVRNTGWEVVVRARPIARPGQTLALTATWARNRNRVVGLDLPAESVPFSAALPGGGTFAMRGQPLGVFRGLDFARCGRGIARIGTEDVRGACIDAPAHALYIGTNGFPVIDPETRVLGDPYPDWTAGMDAALTIGRAGLSVFVEHRQGGVTQNMTRSSLQQYGTHGITELRGQTRIFGRDFFPGPVAGPGAGIEVTLNEAWFVGQTGVAGPRAQFMEDATHTRLREVSASYTLPLHWTRAIGLDEIVVRVTGKNLKLWSDYSGYDPETTLGGSAAANRGIDWFTTPLTRGWVFTATLR